MMMTTRLHVFVSIALNVLNAINCNGFVIQDNYFSVGKSRLLRLKIRTTRIGIMATCVLYALQVLQSGPICRRCSDHLGSRLNAKLQACMSIHRNVARVKKEDLSGRQQQLP